MNKPAELKNRNGTNSSASSEGSSLSIHIADSRSSEEPSAETISQEERGGKVKYSLDAGDDSGELILQRISNKLPEWIGGRTDLNERRNKGITRKLSELSGYKVAFGHTDADESRAVRVAKQHAQRLSGIRGHERERARQKQNRQRAAEKIKPTFSEADCDEIIAAGTEKFGAAQKDLVEFSKTTLRACW